MSITFYIEETAENPEPLGRVYAREQYPSLCETLAEEEFEFAGAIGYEKDETGHYFEMRPMWPSANFSEGNVYNVLSAIGLPAKSDGTIEVADLANVRQRIVSAVNRRSVLRGMVRPPEDTGRPGMGVVDGNTVRTVLPGQVRIIDPGSTAERGAERLQAVLGVVIKAQELGLRVHWA